MTDLFAYTDYRKFLRDFYAERKASVQPFSYRSLSLKAGFANKGFLHNVLSGRKNLSQSSAIKLAEAMKLTSKETEYFENLVAFTQARTHRDRSFYFEKLSSVKNQRGAQGVRQIRKDQYEYYAKWYHSVVRSIIDMHEFTGDYAWLARSVYPPIGIVEAKRSVALLERLGLIKRPGGRAKGYVVNDKVICAGDDIVRLGLADFQLQTTELASRAIRELPRDKRHISGLTLGISRTTYEAMCREIEEFRSRMLRMAQDDAQADSVFQMNFHFFPVSRSGVAAGGKKNGNVECRTGNVQ